MSPCGGEASIKSMVVHSSHNHVERSQTTIAKYPCTTILTERSVTPEPMTTLTKVVKALSNQIFPPPNLESKGEERRKGKRTKEL